MVAFTLDVMSSVATKADGYKWNDEYPTVNADSFENKILTSDLMVIAYDTEGKFVAELPVILCTEKEGGAVEFTCVFDVALPENASAANPPQYRFVVLANCLSQGYGLSYNDDVPQIAGLKYTIPTQAIPMWGVKTHKFTYTDGHVKDNQDLGIVDVLRATAKVGVKLSQDLKDLGYELGELKINKVGNYGYSVPNGWNTYTDTGLLAHAGCFRPSDGTNAMINDVNTFITSSDGTKYIYVPETGNSSDAPIQVSLVLNKKVGDAIVETLTFDYVSGLQFCNYNNGTPTDDIYNIVRNHYYEYTINSVNVGDLFLTLKVKDWDDAPIWDVDFEAPLHTNLMTEPNKGASKPENSPSIFYDNSDPTGLSGAFVGYFCIDSPQGITWKPTLANVSAGDYEVRVYTNKEDNGNEHPDYDILVTKANIEAAQDRFYKVVVVAKNPNNIGNVVKLGLSYAPLWNHEANPLLVINKDSDGLYYPWDLMDGDTSSDMPDISWISIRQVAKP